MDTDGHGWTWTGSRKNPAWTVSRTSAKCLVASLTRQLHLHFMDNEKGHHARFIIAVVLIPGVVLGLIIYGFVKLCEYMK